MRTVLVIAGLAEDVAIDDDCGVGTKNDQVGFDGRPEGLHY